MKNRIDTSRQKTPWDNLNDKTIIQNFIQNKYKDNYNNKHPRLTDTEEALIFNSLELKECRYCNQNNIIKRGKTPNRIQLYYCKDCKKRFTITLGTIFENHKISITEWIEFLLDIFNYGSTSITSKINKNGFNTTNYWLHKIFLILKNYQNNIILSDKVYLDEFYYSVIKSDIKTNDDGSKLRGISKNKFCIGLAYDKTNVLAFVEGLAKPTTITTKNTFLNHIKEGSTLIHDDEKSHKVLVEILQLKDKKYKSSELKLLDDSKNPLRPINHQCDLLRQFLNVHSGFDRKYLQDYLNLYSFMNSGHKNRLEKVEELIKLSLTTKVSLKYRDLYKTKE